MRLNTENKTTLAMGGLSKVQHGQYLKESLVKLQLGKCSNY